MLLFRKNCYTAFVKTLSFILCIGAFEYLVGNNRISYLIANPRASLVEFLRMVGNRGDFKVMHIPANWAYCHAHNYTDIAKGWYREDAPTTYAQAKADILKEVEKAPVFVGENTHTAKDFLEYDKDFIKDPRVQLVFLISNPHRAIIEYYEKKKNYFDKLPSSQLSESIGLKDLYKLLEDMKKNGLTLPLIIKSEDLYYTTKEAVQSVCDYLHVPFKEESLHWKDISENFSSFTDLGWYTIELTECSKHWHGDAIKSTGFSEPQAYALDKNHNPTFEEISNPEHRRICMQAYEENIAYYKLLLAHGWQKPQAGPSENKVTLEAYEARLQEYTNNTPQHVDGFIKEWIDHSLTYVKKGETILELGSGCGRDADYIESQGYKVKRTDAAHSFVELLKKQGKEAFLLNAITDEFTSIYSMFFANGVFLHFTPEETKKVFSKAHASLKADGILACTVKQGEGSGWSEEKLGMPRYYCYWQEQKLQELLYQTGFEVLELKVSERGKNASWISIIARKIIS